MAEPVKISTLAFWVGLAGGVLYLYITFKKCGCALKCVPVLGKLVNHCVAGSAIPVATPAKCCHVVHAGGVAPQTTVAPLAPACNPWQSGQKGFTAPVPPSITTSCIQTGQPVSVTPPPIPAVGQQLPSSAGWSSSATCQPGVYRWVYTANPNIVGWSFFGDAGGTRVR